jgi:hypothetical protein
MPTDKKAVTVYLSSQLYEWVAKVAAEQNRSVSNFIENQLLGFMHPEITRLASPSKIPPDKS